MIEVVEYLDARGVSPFASWRAKLDETVRSRVGTSTVRLSLGNLSAAKAVGSGVFEVRLDFGPGYRIYFGRDGDSIVILLGGGSKKRQHLDIEDARSRWQDYKNRKRGNDALDA